MGRKMWISIVVSAIISVSLTFFANYFFKVDYSASSSFFPNGSGLYLLEVNGLYGNVVDYLVMNNNEVLYATKSTFDGQRDTEVAWAKNFTDFFVVSYGSGVYLYKRHSDSWEEFFFRYNEDKSGNITYQIESTDTSNQVLIPYSHNDVPEIVNNYIAYIRKRDN